MKEKTLKKEFIINRQTAENIGHKMMISGILGGLYNYCKQSEIYFKDINQVDECIIGDKKVKIVVRDIMTDEDLIIREKYYKAHPEIDLYICCKMQAGSLWYVGYIEKEVVDETRIVQMMGADTDGEAMETRRIFAENLKNLSDFIKIYEEMKEEEKIIEQNYTPLHVHSEFSIGDGFGTIKYLAESLHKKGFKACALTDHGTLAGVWEFQKALLEKNIKPIIGCELYVKIPELDKRCHQVVLVKNEQGWKNLLKIHEKAVRDDFYYKPLVLIENLLQNSEGLITTSGCINSPIHELIKADKISEAEEYIKKYKEIFKDDFYGELQLHTCIDNQNIMKKAYELYKKHLIKCIITTDSHYPFKEDKIYHEAIKAISFKKEYGEAGFGDDCFYLMNDNEIDERIKTHNENNWFMDIIGGLKKNTLEIVEKVNFEICPPEKTDTLPKLFSNEKKAKEILQSKCIKGLEERTPYKYEGAIKDRLDLEVDRYLRKGYENYFLIVEDMIKWAKENGIMVGPGRGSVGASLAAYALGITDCDPIKFDLLFDRFISEIRRDAPDIDMDFQDNRRHEIFKYLMDKYGKKNSAKVVTYARFHPKGVLRDIGRIFKIPIAEIEKICNLCIIRSGGDARASFGLMDTFAEYEEAKKFQEKYPLAVEIAIKLEGHIRHKGIHAAALVLTDEPIGNYVPLNKLKDEIVTEWEKHLIEDMNLIKFDILGLKTLTVISDCINDIKKELPNNFNDEKVYEKIFQTGKTLGVFQFETVGLSKLIKELKPKEFSTLYDATTLFRPGALHCLEKNSLIDTQSGKKRICDLKVTDKIKCYVKDKKNSRFEMKQPIKVGYSGEKEIFEIQTKDGILLASAEHKVLTKKGYKQISELDKQDEILMCVNSSKTKFKKKHIPWNKNKLCKKSHTKIHNKEKTRDIGGRFL